MKRSEREVVDFVVETTDCVTDRPSLVNRIDLTCF